MDTRELHQLFLSCNGVSTDTRRISAGSMFFAIRGDRFDANAFATEALDKGAKAVVLDNKEYFVDDRTIVVDDSLAALQQLAAFHRRYLGLPIIGLTGSNGKTTSKELFHAVLSVRFRTSATVGNLNNHIGVPLTLLSFKSDTEVGIVEMGANHLKEIEFLCGLAQPDYGYITNFGKAHLEGFGGIEGVIRGKSELYEYLRREKKTAFVNLDDPIQVEKAEGIASFSFAHRNADADVVISEVDAAPFVSVRVDGLQVRSNLIGLYNATNVSAAIAVGRYFKVRDSDIRQAIESYVPDNNRSQMITRGSNKIILDAYNANPSSMAAAIANFSQLPEANKVAILGDMFELGAESSREHSAVVELSKNIDGTVVFVGSNFHQHASQFPDAEFVKDFMELKDLASVRNATILIKGSRGMALERVLDFLK